MQPLVAMLLGIGRKGIDRIIYSWYIKSGFTVLIPSCTTLSSWYGLERKRSLSSQGMQDLGLMAQPETLHAFPVLFLLYSSIAGLSSARASKPISAFPAVILKTSFSIIPKFFWALS